MVLGILTDYNCDLIFYQYSNTNLVGGLEHFSIQLGIVTPTDELHHFSEGVGQPPTTPMIHRTWWDRKPPLQQKMVQRGCSTTFKDDMFFLK